MHLIYLTLPCLISRSLEQSSVREGITGPAPCQQRATMSRGTTSTVTAEEEA